MYRTMRVFVGASALAGVAWWRYRRCGARTTHCTSSEAPENPDVSDGSKSASPCLNGSRTVVEVVNESRKLLRKTMIEQGIPGAVVCVYVNGREVWNEGIGYADVENDVICSPHSVMRIASISKCLTAVAAMQLWEDGLLDLDAPIQTYVPQFPYKTFNGKKVNITCRQILCHMAGIRHYSKASEMNKKKQEFENEEYFIKEHYNCLSDSLKLFSDDDLLHEPGTKFHYTTHGWTLLSAAIEGVSGMPFLKYLQTYILSPVGMDVTGPDKNNPLLYNRSRYYVRNASGRLKNTPYVDVSYKWAGGGLYSSASDLCKFGSALLLSYQCQNENNTPAVKQYIDTGLCTEAEPFILKPISVKLMWTEHVSNALFSSNPQLGYGLGWILRQGGTVVKGGKSEQFCAGHTGAAVGASSVLIILPTKCSDENHNAELTKNQQKMNNGAVVRDGRPRGVVVAILFNLQGVTGTFSLGSKVATLF